ncbi:hypothetical protein ARMSODRAFT_975299 [Armillaria solidipes]|uniref:Uncharacterized protein n=1 Tax=Armillaria solidipes TaxID=1076256 RepID=A0A2H3BDM7_9AGAR|nr:hypothetical protein ARMSODRAFT_975299 [Armillaria solidipes]
MPLGGWSSTRGFLVKELREQRLSVPVEGIHTSDLYLTCWACSVGGLLAVRVCHDHFDEVVVVEPEAWIKFPETGRSDPWNQESKRSSDPSKTLPTETHLRMWGNVTYAEHGGVLPKTEPACPRPVEDHLRPETSLFHDTIQPRHARAPWLPEECGWIYCILTDLGIYETYKHSQRMDGDIVQLCFSSLGVGDLPVTLEKCKAFT